MKKFLLFALFTVVATYTSAYALGHKNIKNIRGNVIRVIDGEAFVIDVMRSKAKVTVKMAAVNAHATGTTYGKIAKEELEKFILKKTVIVEYVNKDIHGRPIGYVITNQKKDVTKHMIENGYVDYNAKSDFSKKYLSSYNYARKKQKGIHAPSKKANTIKSNSRR